MKTNNKDFTKKILVYPGSSMPPGESNVHIEITDAPELQTLKNFFNAWNITFFGAIGLLLILCNFSAQAKTYSKILNFVSDGVYVTLEVATLSLICTIPIGLITGFGRSSSNKYINLVASIYVEVIRGIPLLVQLFYIYYALGNFSPLTSAIISISFCYGGYMGEVFKAGILAIPKGQIEAASSLGFNKYMTMRYIILPQALRIILPSLGNESISMLKDTSLISIIAVADLLRRGREYATQTFDYFETYTLIALIYLIITLLLSKAVSIMEGKVSHYDNTLD